MKNTLLENTGIIDVNKARSLKDDLLKQVKTLDSILSIISNKNTEVTTHRVSGKERRKRGSSSRVIPSILAMRGEFTFAKLKDAMDKNLDAADSEIYNQLAALKKSGKIITVKSGLGRAIASYKVAKNPVSLKSE